MMMMMMMMMMMIIFIENVLAPEGAIQRLTKERLNIYKNFTIIIP